LIFSWVVCRVLNRLFSDDRGTYLIADVVSSRSRFTVCGKYAIVAESDISVLRCALPAYRARHMVADLTRLDGSDAVLTARTA